MLISIMELEHVHQKVLSEPIPLWGVQSKHKFIQPRNLPTQGTDFFFQQYILIMPKNQTWLLTSNIGDLRVGYPQA